MPISVHAENFIFIFFSFWYIRRISCVRTYDFRFNYQPKSSRSYDSRSFAIPHVLYGPQRRAHTNYRNLDVQRAHGWIRTDLPKTCTNKRGLGSTEGPCFSSNSCSNRITANRESRQAVRLNSIRLRHKDLEIVLKWDNVKNIDYTTSPIARA